MNIDTRNKWAERPLGMSDVYPQVARLRREVEMQLLQFFESWGCDMVSCGVFEFAETLQRGRRAGERDGWIQMIDSSGRAVALRPEMTPSIARMAAPLISSGQRDIRWCYAERVYRRLNDPASLTWTSGVSAESTQAGVEWIGMSGVEVDCALLTLCQGTLQHVGIQDWQVVVGHALFTPALLLALGVQEERLDAMLTCLTEGDYVGFKNLAMDQGFEMDLLKVMSSLNPYDERTIRTVLPLCVTSRPNARDAVLGAWTDLVQLASTLDNRGIRQGITFDLTLHRDLTYYTGIVFEVFAPGVGAPIASGGRYDELLGHFGPSAPAIGFAFEVERLLRIVSSSTMSHGSGTEES